MKRVQVLALMSGIAFSFNAQAASASEIEDSFFPYNSGVPTHSFVKPGVVINASNVEQAKDVLDSSIRIVQERY